jgi:hypothetical protein
MYLSQEAVVFIKMLQPVGKANGTAILFHNFRFFWVVFVLYILQYFFLNFFLCPCIDIIFSSG